MQPWHGAPLPKTFPDQFETPIFELTLLPDVELASGKGDHGLMHTVLILGGKAKVRTYARYVRVDAIDLKSVVSNPGRPKEHGITCIHVKFDNCPHTSFEH